MVFRNIISPNILSTWHSDSIFPLFHNLSLANSFHFHTHWPGYGPVDYFALYWEMTISGRVLRICYTWHCSNKWIVVKWLFSLKISLFHSTIISQCMISFFSVITCVAKPQVRDGKVTLVCQKITVFPPSLVILITVTASSRISTWICCCSACALAPVRSSTPIRHFTVTWPPVSLAVFN